MATHKITDQLYKKNIYFFIGTTTELVRVTPIIKELKKRKIPYKIISSGQNTIHLGHVAHYIKDIKIDIFLKEKSNKSSAIHFLIWSVRTLIVGIISLRKEFTGLNKNNSNFVIFGDPVSTSIGALIAKFYRLHIVHLESGDFSFNLTEPFPEEICRNINVRLADVLFPPSKWAFNNLKTKKLKKPMINTYYNTQLEIFQWSLKRKPSKKVTNIINKLDKYYILIMHRQEHVFFRKSWSQDVLKFVIENSNSNLNCVVFDHPLTQELIQSIKGKIDSNLKQNIKSLKLLPYSDFLHLMKNAEYIASDSATNQYETYLIGKPYLALRNRTEQQEGLGKNVVISRGNQKVMKKFLSNYKNYRTKQIYPKLLPSKIIVDYLQNN